MPFIIEIVQIKEVWMPTVCLDSNNCCQDILIVTHSHVMFIFTSHLTWNIYRIVSFLNYVVENVNKLLKSIKMEMK